MTGRSFPIFTDMVEKDGYYFMSIDSERGVYDAIVFNEYPSVRPVSVHTKEEQIAYINQNHIKKAFIQLHDLEWLQKCFELEYLHITPPSDLRDGCPYYEPLYQMRQLKSLSCLTDYGVALEKQTEIDYQHFPELVALMCQDSGHFNISCLTKLKTLILIRYGLKELDEITNNEDLDSLELSVTKLKNLNGLERLKKLQCLYLHYNRSLSDISGLENTASSLTSLCIDHCGKISDYSVLSKLKKLEYLELRGNKALESLSFLQDLPMLKTFILEMEVSDRDLSACLHVPNAILVKEKRGYNYRDSELPKSKQTYSFDSIEQWRKIR